MTRGYLILAQNTRSEDYLRMAYALALSIKNSQSTENNVTLATDNISLVPLKYGMIFDNIVEIPWTDAASLSKWKIENKWKYYYMTPYDETVILDADMIFSSDVSHWWDILSQRDVWITDKPQTYRGEIITSDKYRKTFTANELPNVYTAFMYFKKGQLAAEIFKLTGIIFDNWDRFFYTYLDETRPRHLSGDVAFALAIKILGVENQCFGNLDGVPSFVHMKSDLQNLKEVNTFEDWTQHIPTYFRDDGGFKIGNYEQTLPFHYHIKEWLTDDIVSILEKRVSEV